MQAVSGSQLCLAGPLRLTLPLGSLKKPSLQHYLSATKRFFQGSRGHFLQKERLRCAKLQRMTSTVAADDTTRLHVSLGGSKSNVALVFSGIQCAELEI
jgi:hypothetical protein